MLYLWKFGTLYLEGHGNIIIKSSMMDTPKIYLSLTKEEKQLYSSHTATNREDEIKMKENSKKREK